MNSSVTILGAGSATPTLGRYPSAQVFHYENDCYLIDCGEGTQYRLMEHKIRPGRLKGIFISHLHGDHYFGLIGLLSSLSLSGRTEPLQLFGPRGLDELLTLQSKLAQAPFSYPLHFTTVETDLFYQIYDTPHFTVHALPLHHRIPCAGFLFREKPHLRKLIKEKISDEMPHEYLRKLKNGEDIFDENGTLLHAHQELTLPAPPPRSYAYCSDTCYDERLVEYLKGVDLVYHEATFQDDMAHQAAARFHATAREAATIAHKAQVGRLLIGHFSSRYKDFSGFLEQARSVFPRTEIAREGMNFLLESSPTETSAYANGVA
ncbi:MAG: ribonuclease Z [Runella sp.]